MSVHADKYLGYVIDIQKEWNKLSDVQVDKWLTSEEKITDVFQPYYCNGKIKDKITVLDDGMNCEYTKLVYIVDYCTCVDAYDEDEAMVNSINKYLNKVNIPNEILQKLMNTYKEIFGIKPIEDIKIQMEYFIHWH